MPEGLDLQIIVGGNAIPILHRAVSAMPAELSKIVGQAGQAIRREAVIKVNQTFGISYKMMGTTDPNTLGKSISVIVQSPTRAIVGPTVVYGAIHEFGGVIHAKNKPYLMFQYPKPGEWKRVKQVTMAKRPYMGPATETARPKIKKKVSEMLGRLFGPTSVTTEVD